jgi:cytochrome c biogenesis protein CcdA
MELLLASFIAGLLTILAPCAITLLPVIIGGSVQSGHKYRPLVVAASLGISIFLFGGLLKGLTEIIDFSPLFWRIVSGLLIIFVGLTLLFPLAWTKLAIKLKLYKSEELLQKNATKEDFKSAILLGASLGPVFTTCSPTFLFIVAIILPQNFWTGMINLVAYTLGVVLLLLVVGYLGQTIVKKLKFAVNPNGWFKKIIAILLILVGAAVITGFDKTLESLLLDAGYSNGLLQIEESLMPNDLN